MAKITVARAALVGVQVSELSEIAHDTYMYLLNRLGCYDNNSRAICLALLQASLTGASVELWNANQEEKEVKRKMEEKPILKCPHCKKDFDFDSLSKNDWCVEGKYIVLTCPHCGELIKIRVEED